MNFATVCSGIEGASVAWNTLGWRAQFFSEIAPFPCALLKHYYPDVPNHGDMTKFKDWPDATFDVLAGGTPCQTYSLAGDRTGLDDPRGHLMLTFGAIAARYRPRWLVWENVDGVLSSDEGRDFASLLGLLSGQAVSPPPDGWKSTGIVVGYPNAYGLAWRVLDAQYVRVDGYPRAVPQRRKRVFVVGCLGDWRRAAAVLLERESLRGDPAPGRSPGTRVASAIAPGAHPGGFNGQDAYNDQLIPVGFGGNNTSGPIDVATAFRAKGGSGHGDFESETFIAVPRAVACPGDGEVADPLSASEAKTYTHEGANFRMHNVVQQPGGEFDGFQGVRRLTPLEAERLQGLADGYTAINYRGAPAKDGPRYEAIGNGWAINCARWIGMRIQMVNSIGAQA